MGSFKYRADIDGLRALAVLLVIAVHLQVDWLSGGFIGVDVFFVISGYLITTLLSSEFQRTGRIAFGSFFWRRAQRLLPAQVVTVAVTVLGAYFLFSDEQFKLTVSSATYSLFSFSNFYFWSSVGYFDAEATVKPLLHTWSLGVEEQFYLFWPILLLVLLRLGARWRVAFGIAFLGALSFLLNALFIDLHFGEQFASNWGNLANLKDGISSAFYLVPFRIFEFAVGAILAFLPVLPKKLQGWMSDLLSLVGTGLILWLAVYLDEESVFPYYNALMVCVATAVVIFFGGYSSFVKNLYANRVSTFVGRISYSLYLVHWPLIVFYTSLGGELDNWRLTSILFLGLFALGYILYRTVEQPMRHSPFFSWQPRSVFAFVRRAILPVSCLLVAVLANSLINFESRIPEERRILTNSEWLSLERRNYCRAYIPDFPKDIFTCQNYRGSEDTIVIWGDSHALHLVAGFSELFPTVNIAVAYFVGCTPQSGFLGVVRQYKKREQTEACIERNTSLFKWAKSLGNPVHVIITSAKRDTPKIVSNVYNYLLEELEGFGHSAVVLGDFIRPGMQMAQCTSVPDYLLSDHMLRRICKPNSKTVSSELKYNLELGELVSQYVPIRNVQCPNGTCRFHIDGRAIHRDHHHLSVPGSIAMVRSISSDLFKVEPGLARLAADADSQASFSPDTR